MTKSPTGPDFRARLARLQEAHDRLGVHRAERDKRHEGPLGAITRRFRKLRREALLANRLLEADVLLCCQAWGEESGVDPQHVDRYAGGYLIDDKIISAVSARWGRARHVVGCE